ncbi:MAG: 2-hydroxychromene-2-carboxylate isomerase [Proteobacteria bacterium]|nr:2-hydroxychromene-2-carboxylate isomerase [Pseudomonadota bacterium]
MKELRFWFDPISPYAYLAFERLPAALEGISHVVEYRPLLFAGLLKHWGQKGPAEIEPKRAWTFRHVDWTARQFGIPLQVPRAHPFNPLALLRLLIATEAEGAAPNRHACERVLHHAWRGGADAVDAERLAALAQSLALRRDPASDSVKQALRASTDEAVALGIFGVPTVEVGGRLFWGVEGLPMVAQYLRGDAGFDEAGWQEAGRARPGIQRTA